MGEEERDAVVSADINIRDILGLEGAAKQGGKSLDRLIDALTTGIGGAIDPIKTIAKAYADKKSLAIRATALSEATDKIIATLSRHDSAMSPLAERLVERLASEALISQANREAVAFKSIDYYREAASLYAETNDKGIDPDWLKLFWDCAETKSNEDVQEIFARILSRESRTPGTISPYALHLLSILDADSAGAFERICNISLVIDGEDSAIVVEAPRGILDPDDSAPDLYEFGIFSEDFQIVEQLGLLATTVRLSFSEDNDQGVVHAGDKIFALEIGEHADFESVAAFELTPVGAQLRSLIAINFNAAYLEALLPYLKGRGFNLIAIEEAD